MLRSIETALKSWKDNSDRLPIVLRGARQVGKSYTVEKFGTECFSNLVIANFEFNRKLNHCFETLEPEDIIAKIEALTKTSIIPKNTLLFLDEIQECPEALLSLRYFKEKMPELHVIAAGSLLEFILNDLNFSFPVGRVQFMYQRPLSFIEFLLNSQEENLVSRLARVSLENPLEDFLHEHVLDLLRQYLLIGGMPAVLNQFLEKKSYLAARQRQSILLQNYYNDFSKYGTQVAHKFLQELFDKAPFLVGQKFKYASIAPDARARDVKISVEQLRWIGLIYKVFFNTASGIPLKSQKKDSNFKLGFLDIGLLQCATELDYETTFNEDILQINAGAIAEQFVGQELIAYSNCYENKELYFWDRDKKGSTAEIDYVVQYGSHIVGVEVKAGKTGRLKSLRQFMEEKKSRLGVRLCTNALSFENNILSVPLYLISELPTLVASAIKLTK